MSKGLEALQDLSKMVFIYGGVEQYKTIEQELKDYEWLKSKINIDFFYQLPSDDRLKLMEIIGVKYEQ